jgi:hypothetical protein
MTKKNPFWKLPVSGWMPRRQQTERLLKEGGWRNMTSTSEDRWRLCCATSLAMSKHNAAVKRNLSRMPRINLDTVHAMTAASKEQNFSRSNDMVPITFLAPNLQLS